MLEQLKEVARQRPWVPDHGDLLLRHWYDRNRNARCGFTDHDHLSAAARWLCNAQDSQNDGGVAGRYRLDRGWTSSYPETTGYIVPTFLALENVFPGSGYVGRARRAIDFLLKVQLADGSFPGLEIAENRVKPAAFDTGQILCGLMEWHRATSDPRAFAAAERAARWLIAEQDEDGAYRKHIYLGLASTYTAHLVCWLAEWGTYAGDDAARRAAERHLDWVLSHAAPSGWITKMGFCKRQHTADEAFTHTIAYTIWGVLATSLLTGRADGVAVAERAAEGMLRLIELKQMLPGTVSDFKTRNPAACLTGNAQMALIWFKLHALKPNLRFVNAALKAIDLIKAAQPMTGRNPASLGAIAGSDPIGGPYIPHAFPNWAAKFFIDALLEKEAMLKDLAERPAKVQQHLPSIDLKPSPPSPRRTPAHVALITTAQSRKVPAMLRAFGSLPFDKLTVIVERKAPPSLFARLKEELRGGGLTWVKRRLLGSRAANFTPDVFSYCQANGIDLIEIGPLDGEAALAVVKALNADLGVHAGGPILRPPFLSSFRLGVINAHIAVERGLNAAEWPVLEGGSVGCSVHIVDPGIDSGPLLTRRVLDISACRSWNEVWNLADAAQFQLLAEVLGSVLETGALPQVQIPAEAPQHFRMQEELMNLLQQRLCARA